LLDVRPRPLLTSLSLRREKLRKFICCTNDWLTMYHHSQHPLQQVVKWCQPYSQHPSMWEKYNTSNNSRNEASLLVARGLRRTQLRKKRELGQEDLQTWHSGSQLPLPVRRKHNKFRMPSALATCSLPPEFLWGIQLPNTSSNNRLFRKGSTMGLRQ
jgi:hypothetical protein